jgi:hypothetical protein
MGELMKDRQLKPEVTLDLRIHLDKLRRTEEHCREGLERLVDGHLSLDAYLGLLDKQSAAHKAWRSRHCKYFDEACD